MVKNCDLGLENAALGLQFFTIRTSQPANLMMAEEIKAGDKSSWWQGDCKPNRTRAVTAFFESAMNK